MESLKLGPRVDAFKAESDSNNLTLGPNSRDHLGDVVAFSLIFAVAPFISWSQRRGLVELAWQNESFG